LADATSSGNNLAAATVLLDDLAASANADIQRIQANLGNAVDEAAFNELVESTQPTVDGGSTVAAVTTMNHAMNLNGTRLAALRSGDTGMAAGNGYSSGKMWGQVFGGIADQDARDGVDGYDSETIGGAVGFDTGDRGTGNV